MRILHVADTHLGMRQYGLETRRSDFSAAFTQVVSAALDAEVRAVIHAGDLFDNRAPATDDLRDLVTGLARLRQAKIPFLGIVGNHEGKRHHQWLDLFAQLGLAIHLNPEEPFDLDGVPVWGVDYLGRRSREVKPPQLDGGILAMHQLLDKSAPYGELALQDLLDCGARLVLLGDDHEHHVWRKNDVLVSYCGSTERVSISEKARRGFTIVDYETLAIERRELDTRRFLYIGSNREPVRDSVAEMQALEHLVRDAVVVVYVAASAHTPRQLKEEGAARGALHIIVKNVQFESIDTDTLFAIEQLSTAEHLEMAIDEVRDQQDFSDLLLHIEEVVRDAAVPDSRVGERVLQRLEEADYPCS